MQKDDDERTSPPNGALASTQKLCETADVAAPLTEASDASADPMHEKFGERVRRARALRGISQAELSRLSQVDPATVWRIESGERRAHVSTTHKLARALRVQAEWLLTGDEALAPQSPQGRSNGVAQLPEPSTLYTRGSLPDPADGEHPQFIPYSVHTMIVQRAELSPVSVDELRFLCQQTVTDTDMLELLLLTHRAAAAGNTPAAQNAWQQAVQRQAAEKTATQRKSTNAVSSPNTPKKRKPR